jgi:hypothetical protein
MSKFIELIKALAPFFKSQEAVDQAYLAEAIDIIDLERRMRVIDGRDRHSSCELAYGFTAPC